MQLLERESQLLALRRALAEAADGHGRTVLIAGEAGIGKTALVEQFARDAAQGAARVLRGACEALFTPRPLGPLHDMVDALGGPLRARLESNAPPVDLFLGLLNEIRRHQGTSVLVLEDLHWADHATLDLVRFVARRIDQSRALLVITFRNDEVGAHHPLTAVLGSLPAAACLRLELPPLSRATVAELARGAGRSADELYRVTAGNPFFVTEVLRAADAGIAPSVREAVLARAQRLSGAARGALELVSVVPDRVELHVLRQAGASHLAELDECIELGLLRVAGGNAFFRHELARLAIEASLAPLKRAELNARVLAALAAGPGDDPATLTRLAHHAIGADDPIAVTRYGPRAAAIATARGAHREAAALLAAVAPHSNALPLADRAALAEQRAEACFLMGRIEDALADNAAALPLWRELGDTLAVGRNLARRCYILVWGRISGPREIARTAREAVAALESIDAAARRAACIDEMALGHAALAFGLGIEDKAGAARSRAAAMEYIARSTSPAVRIKALALVTFAEYQSCGAPDLATVDMLLREARAAQDDFGVLSAYVRGAWAHYRSWNLAALDELIAQGQAVAVDRQLEDSNHALVLKRVAADCAAARGAWNEAAAQYSDMAAVARLPWAVRVVYCELQLTLIAARRGEPHGAAWVEDAQHREAELYLFDLYHLYRTRLELAWLEADAVRARHAAQVVSRIAADWAHPWALGEAALWNRIVGIDAPASADLPEPYALQIAGDARGAARTWQQLGYRYESALALMLGDDDAQRESVRTFERLAAHGAAERVRARMRESGLRHIPLRPRDRTRANPGGLTQSEAAILALLAEGMSNVQIANRLHRSVRTVEHHVAALLAKLGTDSRNAAVARARERGLVGKPG